MFKEEINLIILIIIIINCNRKRSHLKWQLIGRAGGAEEWSGRHVGERGTEQKIEKLMTEFGEGSYYFENNDSRTQKKTTLFALPPKYLLQFAYLSTLYR